MASFRELVEAMDMERRHVWYSCNVDGNFVHILLHLGSLDAATRGEIGDKRLDEAQHRGVPLGGKYSAQLHSAHTPPRGQQHLHVYAKNNQLFALNMDGTAHDQSHQTQIPRKVADAIRQQFPTFVVPPSNFIESADETAKVAVISTLLME